jgi:anti-anti-sigma factor
MVVKMSDLPSTKRLTVTAPAELAFPFADQFTEHLARLPAEGELVVDLGGVDIMDSAGLRTLLLERTRRAPAGGTVTLANPTPLVIRLLRVTGIDRLLDVEPIQLS